jgi:hypothetical protein
VLGRVVVGRRVLLDVALEKLEVVHERFERVVDLVREPIASCRASPSARVAKRADVLAKADAALLAPLES